jgi:hypothetical protein
LKNLSLFRSRSSRFGSEDFIFLVDFWYRIQRAGLFPSLPADRFSRGCTRVLIVPQRWSPAHLQARLPRARVSSLVSSRNRGVAARVLFFPAKTRRRSASCFSCFPPKCAAGSVLVQPRCFPALVPKLRAVGCRFLALGSAPPPARCHFFNHAEVLSSLLRACSPAPRRHGSFDFLPQPSRRAPCSSHPGSRPVLRVLGSLRRRGLRSGLIRSRNSEMPMALELRQGTCFC